MTRTAPTRRLHPGDLVCGACGEGNPSTRSFCSRCGASLVEAAKVREPWWRRFVPRRGPRVVQLTPDAGGGQADGNSAAHLAKPGLDLKFVLRQIYRKGRIGIAVALLCAGTLYGTYPPFQHAVDGRVRRLKTEATGTISHELSPIHAVSVTANVSAHGHPALNAADEVTNRYWLAPWSTSAEPALTFRFEHHVTVQKIILRSGASDAYVQDGRPSELRLTYSNGKSFTIVPKDTSQDQTFSVSHANLVTSMRMEVGAVYPGSHGSTVAIAEIELFGFTT
ncbi:zinc ribbon domain-containing protein [Streptomyces fuscichromogenes]|uniref:Zinc ribbon domain-containing protein n=1 Tax=Streptomyces fuscichromogenes TaxID=1324013 RepID=A0A918CUA0_9ACTN|nr:zinc ribbon domain-containing protein [Streptomyces fuscichromogenes]GGN27924.1 zinc ribbon domain-containing protein [Streptomyces fuscichromogenes]